MIYLFFFYSNYSYIIKMPILLQLLLKDNKRKEYPPIFVTYSERCLSVLVLLFHKTCLVTLKFCKRNFLFENTPDN